MPELPDVELQARRLRDWLERQKIVGATVAPSRVIRPEQPRDLERLLVGRTVAAIARRGKWLRFDLSGGAALYSHLGMTGRWVERSSSAKAERHELVRLEVGKRSVRYLDPRLFGRLIAAPDGEPLPEWQALGPDLLDEGLDPAELAARLHSIRRSIKETLLDQRLFAGVGNIHAQEALWRARIHPQTPSRELGRAQLKSLVAGLERSIADALQRKESSELDGERPGAANPFDVYDNAGAPCPRCGTALVRIVQGGRATTFCPRCQVL